MRLLPVLLLLGMAVGCDPTLAGRSVTPPSNIEATVKAAIATSLPQSPGPVSNAEATVSALGTSVASLGLTATALAGATQQNPTPQGDALTATGQQASSTSVPSEPPKPTETFTPSPTMAIAPAHTHTPTPTRTPTAPTRTPIAVPTFTPTPIAVPTLTPTPIALPTLTPTPIALPTLTPTPIALLTRTPTPTATPTRTPTPTATPGVPHTRPPTPAPAGTAITDGQEATIPCGTGAASVDASVSGIRPGLNGLIIGDTATVIATAPNGTLLRWVFGGPGSLTIDGCTAVYSVTSIGSAYQTSATIRILRAAAPTPTPTPTPTPPPCPPRVFGCGGGWGAGREDAPTPGPASGGEGGPGFVWVDKTLTLNVYDPANQPQGACTLAGIAMSINSVPTTDVVVWYVMTPRTAPFFVARPGRNVTVVDGGGLYTIQLWVNGVFREQIQEVAWCPIAVIRR